MFNLEKRFAVVGVMEHFKTSIALMEAMLPRLVWYWSAGLARFPSLVETSHILQFPSLVHTSYILPFWSPSVQVVPRSRKSSRIRWEKHLVTKVTFIECGAAPSASTQACSYEMVTKVFFREQLTQEREPTPRTFFENGWNSPGSPGKRYSLLSICGATAKNPEHDIFGCTLAEKDSLVWSRRLKNIWFSEHFLGAAQDHVIYLLLKDLPIISYITFSSFTYYWYHS